MALYSHLKVRPQSSCTLQDLFPNSIFKGLKQSISSLQHVPSLSTPLTLA